MSLLARHRFILGRLSEVFNFLDEQSIEKMMLAAEVLQAISEFFAADGPTKIIFAVGVEVEAKDLDSSSKSRPKTTSVPVEGKRLRVYFDEVDQLPHTAVYFMKTKRGGQNLSIDATKVDDGSLSFGVVRGALESLDALIKNVYNPMFQEMGTERWGEASSEQRNEFLVSVDMFSKGLENSIRNLRGGIELSKPDERVEMFGAAAAGDQELVVKSLNLLNDWCKSIEEYLDDSDRSRWESADSGPDTELHFWKSRTQRLASITEQLKNRSVKSVVSLLSTVARPSGISNNNSQETLVDAHRVISMLAQWKEIDVQITEAANEAKDNVKYLSTLERFFDTLYGRDPVAIIDTLPALVNAVRMIHTIARYYGTTERITRLFMKLSNQMITACKLAINGKDSPDRLWEKDLPTLLEVIEKCLQLNEGYQDQYRSIKERMMQSSKGKQFDFSETQIFGKFDLFCRRLIKLMDMFSTMQQFRSLSEQKFEGLEPLLATFEEYLKVFREKGHDLLDYHSNRFDRDFVDFNVKMNELERSLQRFINRSFENMGSIDQSLSLLKKYQAILNRENIRSDLESKLSVIFNNYGLELNRVKQIYEKHKHDPPINRNMPPVAGNIAWARHLLKRVEDPMLRFQGNSAVLGSKDSKKIVRAYNKVARTLIAFEYLWYEAWCASVEEAKAGLQATLVIRHPETGKLYVNFDKEIFQLIREAKCLVKLDVVIPDGAKMILLQEEKFKSYYHDLKYMLSEYERVTKSVIPITQKLLLPHLRTMELKLRPGMVTLTWTSMNIDAYKSHIHDGLSRLEELVSKVNDIVVTRIQKNLKQISRSLLIVLPLDRTITLDEFVSMEETCVRNTTIQLAMKNRAAENAVADLFAIITATPTVIISKLNYLIISFFSVCLVVCLFVCLID